MILSLLKKPDGLQTINIGNGHPIRLNRIVSIAQKVIGRYGYSVRYVHKPANSIEMTNTWADTSKIKRVYTKQTTSFEHGFANTADFFFKHADLYVNP